MVPSRFATVVALLAAAALTGAAPAAARAITISVVDPAHDIMVTDDSLLVPVDSIDLVGYTVLERTRGQIETSLSLSDLTRRGLEDRLFVHSAHSVRVYGATTLYEDYRALQLLVALVDEDPTPIAAAYLLSPEGAVEVPVTATVDLTLGTVEWRLDKPIDGVVAAQFSFATLQGCDDFDTCEPPMPGLVPMDMAPNELADPSAVVIPAVWWDQVLPQDDGSVPSSPVSLAGVADPATP